jgi:hypothetical protein
MNSLPLAEMDALTDAAVIFGVVFVFVLLATWWARTRRRPARRLPYQTDVDDFARIYRP